MSAAGWAQWFDGPVVISATRELIEWSVRQERCAAKRHHSRRVRCGRALGQDWRAWGFWCCLPSKSIRSSKRRERHDLVVEGQGPDRARRDRGSAQPANPPLPTAFWRVIRVSWCGWRRSLRTGSCR